MSAKPKTKTEANGAVLSYVLGKPGEPTPLGGVVFSDYKTATNYRNTEQPDCSVLSLGWVRKRNPEAVKGLRFVEGKPDGRKRRRK